MSQEVSEKIESFFSSYRVRRYAKGQILTLSGEIPSDVFYLVSGKVKKYDVTYRGEEIILNIFKPPAFFPMSHAINQGMKNPYIYEAASNIEVRQAPAKDVLAFAKANPDVLVDLLSRVYLGMEGILGRMSRLMGSSAMSRLIYELVIEARRFGISKDDGTYELTITEKELGSRIGISRETVSREIAKLKAKKLVEVIGSRIFIKDVSALESKIDPSD